GLTLAELLLLSLFGMPPWEALLHSLTTLATGGYSPKTASIAAYPGPLIQWTIVLFMFLAGTNFGLQYFALRGELGALVRNAEFRLYGAVVLAGGLLLASLVGASGLASGEAALRAGFFQATSILTTTGYATYDFGAWPAFAQGLLLLFMFFGGCSGSTGGGMKHIRLLLLARVAGAHLRAVLHPLSVVHVRANGHTATPHELRGLEAFLFLYLAAWGVGTLVLAFLGQDLLTALSAAASALGNVGPGLGAVGPAENYAALPALAKWLLSFLMLLGRLEVIPLMALFSRALWGR
ncbi:MAG: TrkH family potassium uptake protein, partial [Nitrospinota bacterium]